MTLEKGLKFLEGGENVKGRWWRRWCRHVLEEIGEFGGISRGLVTKVSEVVL